MFLESLIYSVGVSAATVTLEALLSRKKFPSEHCSTHKDPGMEKRKKEKKKGLICYFRRNPPGRRNHDNNDSLQEASSLALSLSPKYFPGLICCL